MQGGKISGITSFCVACILFVLGFFTKSVLRMENTANVTTKIIICEVVNLVLKT